MPSPSVHAGVECGMVFPEFWRAHLLPKEDGHNACAKGSGNQGKAACLPVPKMLPPSVQHPSSQVVQVFTHAKFPFLPGCMF